MNDDNFARVKESVSLKEYAEAHLTHVRGGLVCPCCGSGTGANKTPAFSIRDDKWKCFSCDANGDVFDIAGIVYEVESRSEQLRIVAEWAGIPIEDGESAPRTSWSARTATESRGERRNAPKGTDTPKTDYTEGRERHRRYVAECAERLREMPAFDEARLVVIAYLFKRGIGEDEAIALGLGYDPDYKGRGEMRIIIPWAGSDYYHIDRAIGGREKGKYNKPKADEVGEQPLYNPQAFEQDYIIVVEGALDAIAVQLCGYNAVALGGTGANAFANEAARRKYSGVVIDMLDCDGEADEQGKGRAAGKKLVSLMADAGITTLARSEYGIGESDTYSGAKDAGELLAKNRADLTQMLEYMRACAEDKAETAKETGYREALRHFHVKNPAEVARDVLELRDVYEPVPTGIKSLDAALGGGVSLGELTIFGAISSYGKTTLAVQIADYMASRGRSVLFVTIEQSAKELIAKSLSRLVYTENTTGWNVATPSEIASLATRRAWGDGQNATLSKAVEDYERLIAPNMRIMEGDEQPTVKDIRAVASFMAENDGQAPIIFIDYLQLLAPLSERYDTDKRNADMNVSELRKLARDLTTHVWCISSLNRESYTNGVTMTAFKESGSLEFGSDNLIGLQMRNMAEKLKNASGSDAKVKREVAQMYQENKAKPERDCELVVLKQRNGALPGEPLPLTFKPMSAYFTEPVRM